MHRLTGAMAAETVSFLGRAARGFRWRASLTSVAILGATLIVGAQPAQASTHTFQGQNLGPIPDRASGAVCGENPPPPGDRFVTFAVSGLTGTITDVQVGMTFDPSHKWAGDIVATISSPLDNVSRTLFAKTGAADPCSFGDGSDLAGPYTFSDGAAGSPTWWEAAAGAGAQAAIPPGTYRASQISTGENTLISPEFASVENPNGQWTLYLRDTDYLATGSVSAAHLQITTAAAHRTLTITKGGSGSGAVTAPDLSCTESCTKTYEDGTPLTLSASASDGSTFAGWSGACSNASGPCELTMDDDRSVTATFDDVIGPETTILSGPNAKTRDYTPTFTFVSDDEAATFECSVDGSAPSSCASPYTTPRLRPGTSHTFSVRAVDGEANVDLTPAMRSFVVKKRRR